MKKFDSDLEMEAEEANTSRLSGTRRTRSKAAPDWAPEHALILVNEFAAIEMDCSNTLSTFQKWKIIVENCNALGVPRSLDQCRRKLNSLLDQYNSIRKWEAKSRTNSYWWLGDERRKACGLPEAFDEELFRAIDVVARAKEDKSSTDLDSEAETQEDTLEAMEEELGLKKQRRIVSPLKSDAEVEPRKFCALEEKHVPEKMAKRNRAKEKKLHEIKMEERHQTSSEEENPERSHAEDKHTISTEERERIMVAKLYEDTEEIHAIVEEADLRASDLNEIETLQGGMIRRQGDELIARLGDILNTLKHLTDTA